MRTTGYIGQQDEGSVTWMSRIMSRINAIRDVPEHYSLDYFKQSLIYSKTSNPWRSYNITEKAIKKGELYRNRGRFNVVLYPDKDSVLRSALPPEEIFLWYPGQRSNKKTVYDDFTFNTDECTFDEYLNTQTHVSELDFIAEVLFAPNCRTVESFACIAAEIAFNSVPAPMTTTEWAVDAAARKAAELAGIAALHDWTVYMRKRVKICADEENGKNYTRLSWYYGKLLREVSEILHAGYVDEIDEKLVKTRRSLKSIETSLGAQHKEEFRALMRCRKEILTDASDILYSAYLKMAAGAFSRNAGGRLYMGGCAKSISCITGGASGSTEYLSWLLRTASLYPDAVVYALELEKWNKAQLKALECAVKQTNSANLLIWTSADPVTVPDILMRGDYITSDDIDPETGIIMYKSPYKSEETEDDTETIRITGDLIVGSIDDELADLIGARRQDPLCNTPSDYGNKVPSVAVPYELLPEDKIEEAREMILYMTGLTASKINKPGDCSDDPLPPINII